MAGQAGLTASRRKRLLHEMPTPQVSALMGVHAAGGRTDERSDPPRPRRCGIKSLDGLLLGPPRPSPAPDPGVTPA